MSNIPSRCSLSVTCSFRGTRAVKFESGLLKLCDGEDGTKSWVFDYENSGVECSSHGLNAYPSYKDYETTLEPDRMLLLILAMDSLLGRRYLAEYI